MQRSPNIMRKLAHSNTPIEKWNELFLFILGSSSVPKDTILITWTNSNDMWAIQNNCFSLPWKQFIVKDSNSQQEQVIEIFKWDFQITGLSRVCMMNAFPLTKMSNVQEAPNSWKQTLNTAPTSYLKIGIIIRMPMVFQVLLGKSLPPEMSA